jgi:peptidoglycan/xylan/chitin deacetylase (PgdA/CDA1 family)
VSLRNSIIKVLVQVSLLGAVRKKTSGRRLILCYHSLRPDQNIDRSAENASMCSSRALPISNFRDQVDWLLSFADIVPLDALLRNQGNRRDGRWRVALTFDDGYENNISLGKRVLAERSIPMTWFVATKYCERTDRLTWWDLLDYIANFYHERLLFEAFGNRYDYGLGSGASERRRFLSEQRNLFLNIVEDQEELQCSIEEALSRKGIELPQNGFATPQQVSDASNLPWVNVGAHTCTHVNVARVGAKRFASELRLNFEKLKSWTQEEIRWFAYPYGRKDTISNTGVETVVDFGFDGAVTTTRGYVVQSSHRFRLPRMVVGSNWSLPFFQSQVLSLGFWTPLLRLRNFVR